jgi:putative ABC transport system ATP-binding protein
MILSLRNIVKNYPNQTTAVRNVTLDVGPGEFTALAGPSGSGKTTMLILSAGLDQPSQGQVVLLGHDLSQLPANKLSQLRREKVGFVFQEYNLFPVLTALENVEYPLALRGVPAAKRRELARKSLEETGCGALLNRLPRQLSGGQQQRVAIARAIAGAPEIVFADEPTANLDSETAKQLLVLFRRLNEEKKITFLFSSHDPIVLNTAKRIIHVADGKISQDENHAPAPSDTPRKAPVLTVVANARAWQQRSS